MNGVPHYFESLFSDELDEYSLEFELWPIDDDALGRELSLSREAVLWRSAFNAGESLAPPAPNGTEESALDAGPRRNRRDAFSARPEWRLDQNRSHAIDPPRHLVCWHR